MHQIISGETLKTKVLKRSHIDVFLENNIALFDSFYNQNNRAIYKNKKIINDHVLNYLNIDSNFSYLKDLIRKEFDECEKIYPYLGDIFVNCFFEKIKNKSRNQFKFNKSIEKKFINSLKSNYNKEIAKLIFKNASLEYMINFESYEGNSIILEKNNNVNFKFEFDNSYYLEQPFKKIKNYNCIIIDGIIDTVGEIHHLLYQASLNKEDYVIFCLGVNDEVKNTILTNNKRRITKVWPIEIKMSEKTLNILNDIAVVHDTEIISALKGQTISQEIKKNLKKGISIVISNSQIVVEPLQSKEKLSAHKQFLLKRIDESPNEENSKLLKNRYKSLSSKTINVYLPKLLCEPALIREADYLMRFLSNLNKVFTNIKIKNKEYYIPTQFFKIAIEKANQTKKTINNIDKIISIKQEKK